MPVWAGGGAGRCRVAVPVRHRTSERSGSLFSMAVAVGIGGDLDPFEAPGGDSVLELDPRVAAEVAGDELGDGVARDDADRLFLVAADQWAEGLADPLLGVLDGLPLGGADGGRVVEPLPEDLQV